MTFCEYCDMHLINLADVRRHILSMAHTRHKNSHELSMIKYFERKRQTAMHPDNFAKLCLSLNMHSDKDVSALEKDGFFKMERLWHYDVAEELLKVLMESGIKYYLDKIHPVLRKELIKSLEEEKAAKAAGQETGQNK
jgi:hypothetical protein